MALSIPFPSSISGNAPIQGNEVEVAQTRWRGGVRKIRSGGWRGVVVVVAVALAPEVPAVVIVSS